MRSNRLKIHKTCPTWGETICYRPIFVTEWKKRPITTYEWKHVTCKICLNHKRKIKNNL